jgi:hypothetical protein
MARLAAMLAAVALLGACSTQPPPTGPGTATLDISGSRGDCFSFGGCQWWVILRTDDAPQALDDEHDADLVPFPDARGPQLLLGHGLPGEIEDGGYVLTFEERLISDSQDNEAPLEYGVGSTCSTPFTVGAGRSIVIARVAFSGGAHEHPPCTISLRVDTAS